MAAPSLRAVSAVASGTAGSSVVISKPTGVAQYDVMIMWLWAPTGFTTITTPSGWSVGGSTPYTIGSSKSAVYYLTAGAAEPSTYTVSWTGGGATTLNGFIIAYQGAVWYAAGFESQTGGSATDLLSPGETYIGGARATVGSANSLFVKLFGQTSATNSYPTWTVPGTHTERINTAIGATSRFGCSDTPVTLAGLVPVAQASPWTSSVSDAYGQGVGIVLSSSNSAPNAPTVTAPVSGTYQDFTVDTTVTVSWTFSDPDSADTQSAYAIKRKDGAGSDDWWNGSTWGHASETWVTSTATSVTLSGTWTNGHTYSIAVATKDNNSTAGAYCSYITLVGNSRPTTTATAPTGTITTTSFPTVTWTYSDSESNAQEAYQVYTSLSADDPTADSSLAIYSSGVVVSSGTSVVPTVAHGPSTTNKAWVRTRQTGNLWSAWSSISFTMNLSVPNAPTISLSAQSDRIRATVTKNASGTTTHVSLQRSYDNSTWTAVRNQTLIAYSGATTMDDFFMKSATTVYYRAIAYDNTTGAYIGSSASSSSSTTWSPTTAWLMHPTTSSYNCQLAVATNSVQEIESAQQGMFMAFGRSDKVLVDGDKQLTDISVQAIPASRSAGDTIKTLFDLQTTVLLQLPSTGIQRWVHVPAGWARQIIDPSMMERWPVVYFVAQNEPA